MPADLRKHTRVEAFLVQRSKFKYCMFVSLINSLLIMLSTIMRILITFDTYQKEEKILMSYYTLKNDHDEADELKSAAQSDGLTSQDGQDADEKVS